MFLILSKKCNYIQAKRLALALIFSFSAQTVCAAMSLISIDLAPGFSTNIPLYQNGSALVLYVITNHDTSSQSFEISVEPQSIGGGGGFIGLNVGFNAIIPATENSCAATQTLAPQASCTLGLLIEAGGLISDTRINPVITINPFWKFKSPQSLDVSIDRINAPATLSGNGLALSVKNPGLNAALTGTPREIQITNSGPATATDVNYVIAPPLPDDASIAPSSCGDIAPGKTCTLTIEPGATAVSSTLYTRSSNSSALSLPLNILSYGSEYQSGYVFSIDDTVTPITASVGGKVAALSNQVPFWPLGRIWSSNGDTSCAYSGGLANFDPDAFAPCTDYDVIPGINETSTTAAGDACNGNTDGACDTNVIVDYFDNLGIARDLYAAGLCKASIGGFEDWYLPSICETGYWIPGPNTPTVDSFCGPQNAPVIQNMMSNLFELGVGGLFAFNWSSTQYSNLDNTFGNAWSVGYFAQNYQQTHDGKENTSGVRCVRELT
ncbi:MAG: hypothetical protein P1U36_07830 [Legionellaceae bacterium]|nr:hypothetical protein [Legionellaceae bacterium]